MLGHRVRQVQQVRQDPMELLGYKVRQVRQAPLARQDHRATRGPLPLLQAQRVQQAPKDQVGMVLGRPDQQVQPAQPVLEGPQAVKVQLAPLARQAQQARKDLLAPLAPRESPDQQVRQVHRGLRGQLAVKG